MGRPRRHLAAGRRRLNVIYLCGVFRRIALFGRANLVHECPRDARLRRDERPLFRREATRRQFGAQANELRFVRPRENCLARVD